PCKIYYHDIGDNLSTEKKLERLQYFGSVGGITREDGWQIITPDNYGDWINQRDDSFKTFLALGVKKGHVKKLFETYGILTYNVRCNIKKHNKVNSLFVIILYKSTQESIFLYVIHLIIFYRRLACMNRP
ncbi:MULTISPECIES: hypothetical protein, partial [unclassified Bartonella]|uniref:hypothetical protein n=1 Tax=unclassified Bartonella TaxID=2645622 RepID=UPI0035D06CF7